jgi:hypothetical protein
MLGDLYAPRILNSAEVFRFLRFLLNLDWEKAGRLPLKSPSLVDYQAVASRLDWDRQGRLGLDARRLKVLSLKELPSFTTPNLFRDLAAIPADLVLWSEWKRTENPQLRKSVSEKRRFLWNFKTAGTRYRPCASYRASPGSRCRSRRRFGPDHYSRSEKSTCADRSRRRVFR